MIDSPDVVFAVRSICRFLELDKFSEARVHVDFYTTRGLNLRAELAQLDYSGDDFKVADLLHSKRLAFHLYNCEKEEDVIPLLRQSPVHIVYAFDQSQYRLEDGPKVQQLLVSPLVVTYQYSFSRNFGKGTIAPSSEAEEGLFSDYHFLVNRGASLSPLKSIQMKYGENTVVEHINVLLADGATQWLAVADRMLTPYAPLKSVPIAEHRDGQREIGVWAHDESRAVSRFVDLIVENHNLIPQESAIAALLQQFGHIAGSGLYTFPSHLGNLTACQSREKGLLGTVLAAAWYVRAFSYEGFAPLVASLDSNLARQWLQRRIGSNRERADLVGIRLTEEGLAVDVIEVKTRDESPEITIHTNNNTGEIELTGHAADQVMAILETLKPIFNDRIDSGDLFTPARREVLRYQVHRECFREFHDNDWQKEWFDQLSCLFAQPPQTDIQLSGLVIHVQFDNVEDDLFVQDSKKPVDFARIGLRTVQSLISSEKVDSGVLILNNTKENMESSNDFEDDYHSQDIKDGSQAEMPQIVNDEVDEEAVELSRRFLRACLDFQIGIAECDPKRAVCGPNVWRFYVRLAPTQKYSPLKRDLEDIGRRMKRSGLITSILPNSEEIALDVPRLEYDVVEINSVLDTFPQIDSIEQLPVAIGVTPEGEHLIGELDQMPHLLIGGTTGSGKTILLYSLLASLLKTHPEPDTLRLFLSSTGGDLFYFDGLAHLEGQEVITDAMKVVEVLQTVIIQEFERRLELLKAEWCVNISEYNEKHQDLLPPFVIVIDEFADLADSLGNDRNAKRTFYETVRRFAQLGRKVGVHLVLCTQRPSANLVPTDIRTLMNSRIALRVVDSATSRMILDDTGAEQLRGRGDLLYREGSQSLRAQGYFVSGEDLRTLMNP